MITGTHFQAVKQPILVADHILPSSAEVKNGRAILVYTFLHTSLWRSVELSIETNLLSFALRLQCLSYIFVDEIHYLIKQH
jgi:hypothetical protein